MNFFYHFRICFYPKTYKKESCLYTIFSANFHNLFSLVSSPSCIKTYSDVLFRGIDIINWNFSQTTVKVHTCRHISAKIYAKKYSDKKDKHYYFYSPKLHTIYVHKILT